MADSTLRAAARRRPVTDAWAIDDGYEAADGAWRRIGEATRRAIVEAMGGDPDAPPPAVPRVLVTRPGERAAVPYPGTLELEDGAVIPVAGLLPGDLPLGYHRLLSDDGRDPLLVIASPGRCHLPDGLRGWGWAVQLYAARSTKSWGIGDLGDLHRLARWSADLGASVLLVNPLLATAPVVPQEASPYCPTSRRYRNILYVRVEDVPGAERGGLALEALAAAGRRLDRERRIERDIVLRLKLDALERLWQRFGGDRAFDAYLAAEGAALTEFATFCALAERYGRGWRRWPAGYRRPDAPAVARFAADHAGRVRFHGWCQWLLDRQVARAGREIALMQDLPIGVDPDGADAWAWQDILAAGASAGAPPDRYVVAGQDWGLPPFVPHRLVAAGYRPFIETVRATLRHAGGLRIDHVMGLFRVFWVPRGSPPSAGAYVRYPADDLLAIVALESHRARAVVVGEDLGTVEDGVRARLAEHRVLSYRLLWFEPDPPARYPELAMAAITTHDLPTIRGLWTGTDVKAQRDLGLAPNEEGFAAIRARLAALTGLPADAPVSVVVERAHALLAAAPSVLVTATLDDALGVDERPNMPGTTTAWPNWSLALPVTLEALEKEPLARAVASTLAGR